MKTWNFVRLAAPLIITICMFVTLCAGQTCPGSSGCLDPTFGNGGISTIPAVGGTSGEGTVQSDGKAVVLIQYSGTVDVIRFNADGGPDAAFGGGDGISTLSWAAPEGRYGVPNAITLQSDDGVEKIILAGYTYVQEGRKLLIALRVDRLMPDGSLDPGFGTGGSFVSKIGRATAVTVQPWDQKIVTAGFDEYALTRLFPDGGLDTSFGNGGVVNTTNIVSGSALALQSDGKIVVAGSLAAKGQKVNMAVARFNPTGTLDTGFGTSGKTSIDFVVNSRAHDVKLAADGKIVLVGRAGEFSSLDTTVARLTLSGQLDSSFSSDGKVTYDSGGLENLAWGVAVRSDGRILAVGHADTLPNHKRNITIIGYDAAGSLDLLFGTNGIVTTDFAGDSDYGRKIFLRNDPNCACEKIIVLGMAYTPTGVHAVAARYLP